jgi:hypothetical protein
MQEKTIQGEPDKLHINDLYPDLTESQQAEAEYYLTGYIDVVRRIFERVHNLTDSEGNDTMRLQ